MFDNIGNKLKIVAQTLTILGIVASILLGVISMVAGSGYSFSGGLLIIIFGSIGFWLSSLGIYGLGQLIENTDKLVAFQEQTHAPEKAQIEDIEDNFFRF